MNISENKKHRKYLVAVLLLITGIASGQKIVLDISNLNKNPGTICIAFFISEADFKSEKPFLVFKEPKTKNKVELAKITFCIPAGEYGISVLHDENMNGKMDYNLLGIPLEGFGFSGYYHHGLKKPVFRNFSFCIIRNETKHLEVKMKYFR